MTSSRTGQEKYQTRLEHLEAQEKKEGGIKNKTKQKRMGVCEKATEANVKEARAGTKGASV